MAEGPPPENSDAAVRVFLGLYALACVFGSIDAVRDDKWLEFVVFFIVALLIAIFDLYWMRFKLLSRRFQLIPALLVVGGIGLLAVGIILAWQNSNHQATSKGEPVKDQGTAAVSPATHAEPKKYYPEPMTLRNLFDSDFSNYMAFWSSFTAASQSNESVQVTYRLLFDYVSNTKFFAFYIPHTDVPTSALINHVLTDYQEFMNIVTSQVGITAGMAGSTSRTTLRDAKFTGRIYIYLEENIGLQDLAAWESKFNEHSLTVDFRSRDYLVAHWKEQREIVNVPQ